MPRSRRLRQIAVASGGTIAGNAVGALLPFAIAALFADRRATDAYFLAIGTAAFATAIFGMVVEGVIVPFATVERDAGAAALRRFVRRAAVHGFALGLGATLAVATAASLALPLLAGDFSARQRHLTVVLLFLAVPLPALVTASSAHAGALYALGRFAVPTWSQGLRAGGALLAALTLRHRVGIEAVAAGLSVGELARLALLRLTFLRASRSLATRPGGAGAAALPARAFWRAALAQSGSMAIIGFNPLVDKVVGASVGSGIVTLLELCEKLFYTPLILVTAGMGIVLGAHWADLARDAERRHELRRDFWGTQRLILCGGLVFALAACAVVALLRDPLADVLHVGRGGRLALTFACYAAGLPAAMGNNLGVRLIVAFRYTRVLPVMAAAGLAANVVLDLAGAALIGGYGIALASSAYRIVTCALVYLVCRRLLGAGAGDQPAGAAEELHERVGAS